MTGISTWRKSGKISNKLVSKACNPNELRIVPPRLARSAQDSIARGSCQRCFR